MQMRNRFFASLLLPLSLAMLADCRSSGPRIVEQGFSSERLGPSSFKVRFEGYDNMSAETVKANLIHHAARLALDNGDLYLIIDGLRTESHSGAETRSTVTGPPAVAEPDPKHPEATPTAPSDRETYHGNVTIVRRTVATATIRTFRARPEDPGALEASKVIERAGGN